MINLNYSFKTKTFKIWETILSCYDKLELLFINDKTTNFIQSQRNMPKSETKPFTAPTNTNES